MNVLGRNIIIILSSIILFSCGNKRKKINDDVTVVKDVVVRKFETTENPKIDSLQQQAIEFAVNQQFEKAMLLLNQILFIDAYNSEALNTKAMIYWNTGNIKEAEPLFLFSFEASDSTDILPLANLTLMLSDQERFNEIEEHVQYILSKESTLIPVNKLIIYQTLFNIAISENDCLEAKKYLDQQEEILESYKSETYNEQLKRLKETCE